MKILELGAGRLSQVAFEFDMTSSEITIGFYNSSDKLKICEKIVKMKRSYPLNSEYKYSQIDALQVSETYDIIIMKSVLGGIFRDNPSRADEFCRTLATKNLNKGGVLITIDNGRSIFEKFIQRYGARKNGWHFFREKELVGASEQVAFGFFSCFSLQSRFGIFGHFLEVILYLLDRCTNSIIKFNPTVICSVYQQAANNQKFDQTF